MVPSLCSIYTRRTSAPTAHHHYKMMHWDTVCSDVKGHITKRSCHMMMHGQRLMIRCMSSNSEEYLARVLSFVHLSQWSICFLLIMSTYCTGKCSVMYLQSNVSLNVQKFVRNVFWVLVWRHPQPPPYSLHIQINSIYPQVHWTRSIPLSSYRRINATLGTVFPAVSPLPPSPPSPTHDHNDISQPPLSLW